MYQDKEHKVISVSDANRTLSIEPIPDPDETDVEADPSLEVKFADITDVETRATGAYFSDSCAGHCLDPSNRPRDHLTCAACEHIPRQDDFRKRKFV